MVPPSLEASTRKSCRVTRSAEPMTVSVVTAGPNSSWRGPVTVRLATPSCGCAYMAVEESDASYIGDGCTSGVGPTHRDEGASREMAR